MTIAARLGSALALLCAAAPASAQFDPSRLTLPNRVVARPIVEVPGRTGRADRNFFQNGLTETVRFGGASERATITLAIPGSHSGVGPTVALNKPTRGGIEAELTAEFPGETMVVVRTPMRNAYGPVGMAVGDRCLFAWQWIDTVAPRPEPASRLYLTSGERPASLRIRLCRRGTESMASLASAVERLRLHDPLSSAPPPAVAERRVAPRRAVTAAKPAAPETADKATVPANTVSPPVLPPRTSPASPPLPGFATVPVPSAPGNPARRNYLSEPPPASAPARNVSPRPMPEAGTVAPNPSAPPRGFATVPVPSVSPTSPSAPRPVGPAPTALDARPTAATPPPMPEPVSPTRRLITDRTPADPAGGTGFVPRPAGGSRADSDEPFTGSLPAEAYRGPAR